MRTFGFNFASKDFGNIVEFKSRKHASTAGNGVLVACSADEIVKSAVTVDQMVRLYNKHSGKQPVAGWESKKAAANCMIALAQAKAKKVQPNESETTMNEKTIAKSVKAPKKEKPKSNGRKGRNSMFDGRVFKLRDGLTSNPRREGTRGYASMAIIILAGPKGISYEDFLLQGGRRVDLAWDLVHDNVVVI